MATARARSQHCQLLCKFNLCYIAPASVLQVFNGSACSFALSWLTAKTFIIPISIHMDSQHLGSEFLLTEIEVVHVNPSAAL